MSLPARPMTLQYRVIMNEIDSYYTVDLSESVSLLSRKAYRQGLEWAVSGIRFTSHNRCNVYVSVLPQTYVTAQSWKAAYLTWRRMQKEARASGDPDAVRAKFSDFKVGFDKYQLDAAEDQYAPNLLPRDLNAFGADANREWIFSEYEFPAMSDMFPGQSLLIHMIGDDHPNISIGAIHNWASGRVRPNMEDPNVPEAGQNNAFDHVFDYSSETSSVIADLVDQNDQPPYWNGMNQTEEEYYPGGKNFRPHWTSWTIASSSIYTSGVGGSYANGFIPGFTAYCGLIRLHFENPSGSNTLDMFIDLLPGPHDGYMARPMQEVN